MLESLIAATSIKEKVAIICDFYKSKRLDNNLEPMWIHRAYEIAQHYLDDKLPKEEMGILHEVIRSHLMPDGTEVLSMPNVPKSPIRIMHQGWKIGTPTWIFMGRNEPDAVTDLGKKWVAVKRTVPPDLYKSFDPKIPDAIWLAYNLEKQFGLDSKNCIGPALYLNQLVKIVEEQSS
jgi:hypothetical protein